MHEFHVLVDTVCGKKKNSLQSGADVTIRSDAVNHCYDRKDNVVRSQIRLVQTL